MSDELESAAVPEGTPCDRQRCEELASHRVVGGVYLCEAHHRDYAVDVSIREQRQTYARQIAAREAARP